MFSSSKYKHGYLVRIWFHPQLIEGSRVGLALTIKRKTIFLFKSGDYINLESIRSCRIDLICATHIVTEKVSSINQMKECFDLGKYNNTWK